MPGMTAALPGLDDILQPESKNLQFAPASGANLSWMWSDKLFILHWLLAGPRIGPQSALHSASGKQE